MGRPRKELDVVGTFRAPRVLTLEQLCRKMDASGCHPPSRPAGDWQRRTWRQRTNSGVPGSRSEQPGASAQW